MIGWIVGAFIGVLLGEITSGLVGGLLDRRPTCAYCGKRQRGATHVTWKRRTANIYEIGSDFWLCSRHSGRVVEYTDKLEQIAKRMNAAADPAYQSTSSDRPADPHGEAK